MLKLTPLVRVLLTGLAAGISVIAATQDSLPLWAQALLVAFSTVMAGLGIVPPTVPTRTAVDTERQPVNVVREQ